LAVIRPNSSEVIQCVEKRYVSAEKLRLSCGTFFGCTLWNCM